jgi:alkaline phosphatase
MPWELKFKRRGNKVKKMLMAKILAGLLCLGLLVSVSLFTGPESDARLAEAAAPQPRNVIFFHPDGYGLSHWDALRTRFVGPDGRLNWDRLPYIATYTGHMRDRVVGTSHGGATTHAWGVKVVADSFGLDEDRPITALSSQQMSIMQEAVRAGFATALIQTGSLTEPGTAAFVASVQERGNHDEIARQTIESGVDVILGGGERALLPSGVMGRHGAGGRGDGLNLIQRAKELGYTVVYTREELLALPPTATRVLGVFAHWHTFNDKTEEALRAAGLPLYVPTAPTVAEMSRAALEILSRNPRTAARGFFMVSEEEGTDNFPNATNAPGSFEAGRRADEAFGVYREFVRRNPRTLLLTAADSSAGSKNIVDWRGTVAEPGHVVGKGPVNSGPDGRFVYAPFDGVDGAGTAPFVSAPDRTGTTFPFAVAWAFRWDLAGDILVRAEGLGAGRVRELGVVDNTDIYRLMYLTLFDRWLP